MGSIIYDFILFSLHDFIVSLDHPCFFDSHSILIKQESSIRRELIPRPELSYTSTVLYKPGRQFLSNLHPLSAQIYFEQDKRPFTRFGHLLSIRDNVRLDWPIRRLCHSSASSMDGLVDGDIIRPRRRTSRTGCHCGDKFTGRIRAFLYFSIASVF